jgi:hypothetical protein
VSATRGRFGRSPIVLTSNAPRLSAAAQAREQGIGLVNGGVDEAPEVCERLPDVLAAHAARRTHEAPPAAAQRRDAGRDVYPYKD